MVQLTQLKEIQAVALYDKEIKIQTGGIKSFFAQMKLVRMDAERSEVYSFFDELQKKYMGFMLGRLPEWGKDSLCVIDALKKSHGDRIDFSKGIGATVALISSNPESRIGKIADYIIKVETQRDPVTCDAHEYEIRQMLGEHRSFAPLGTIFETTSLIFSDAVISTIMTMRQIEESELQKRHTNIE